MEHTSCEAFDRTVDVSDRFLVDDGAFCTIFLVGERKGGGVCQEEGRGRRVEWQGAALVPELSVTHSKLFGPSRVLGAVIGVLANTQEIIERDVGEVADRLGFGGSRAKAFFDTPVWDRDWDGELRLRDRVLTSVALNLLLKRLPVAGGVAVAIARIQPCSQFEVRAEGTKRDLNSLSANLPPSADASTPDEFSKGLQGSDGEGVVDGLELGVQVTVVAELLPSSPIALPVLVRRRHESMGCGCARSSEKTKELSLVLRRNKCQEAPCSRGNCELKD